MPPPSASAKAMRRQQGGFLPPGAIEFVRRRLVQLVGLGLIALAGALATALHTFSPGDPSFNTIADRPVQNALGRIGAALSDLLLQSLGVAAYLPVLVVVLWGLRLIVTAQPLGRLWLRGLAMMFALLLLALALGRLPAPESWTLPAGAGGFAGLLLSDRLAEALPGLSWLVGLAAFVLSVLAAAFAVAIGPRDLAAAFAGMRGAGAAINDAGQKLKSLGTYAGGAVLAVRERQEPKLRRDYRADVEVEDDDEDGIGAVPVPVVAGPREPAPRAEPATPRAAASPKVERPAPAAKKDVPARQGSLDLPKTDDGYQLPPLSLLAAPPADLHAGQIDEAGLAENARQLETVLEDFGVNGKIVKVRPGPVVTLYELEPAPGTKTSRVIGLADDIARSMSALSVRIAVVPGRSVIGIEMPNAKREMVFLRELMSTDAFERNAAPLTLVLGKDIGGAPVMVDLARMPHLLIAGTTGSGKSVAINTMILSLLYRLTPEQCRLIMIDPKMLELSVYDGIPHLLAPVVTEPGKAVVALKWAVREMEDRYRAMSQLGVRNIAGYNQRLAEARAKGERLTRTVQTGFDPDTGKPVYEEQELKLDALPFIVVIVDEMADLMLVAGKDIEAAVQRLAQMARAAGIHILMATQRPSVDVITGTIKANFPTRISFQVTSKIDSRTILGEQGAEQLLGQGDMLYMAAGGRITRVHGPFVSDREVEMVVEHLRAQGEPAYVESVTEEEIPAEAFGGGGGGGDESGDGLYDQAVSLVLREGKASTSFVQRHLQIGYNRAARIIERMESEGVVSRANHVGKREVLGRSE